MIALRTLPALLLLGAPALAARPDPPPVLDPARALSGPDDLGRIYAGLRAYPRRYPDRARLVTLGASHEGRPILALVLGRGGRASRPAVLLDGGHHGGEIFSIQVVLDAIEVLLRDPSSARLLDEFDIWCVPLVNPDGTFAALHGLQRTSRKNGRDNNGDGRPDRGDGVDINRNYPFRWGALGERGSRSDPASYWYRVPAPGSEPETQALMRLGEEERPVAGISYHTGTTVVLSPYTIDGVQNPTPDEAWAVAGQVAAALPPLPGGRTFPLKRQIYAVDGTAQDFLRARYGTLALLVEAAPRTPPTEAARRTALGGLRRSWQVLLGRYLDGPSIYGQVRDRAGRPVAAAVSLREVALHEGEVWTARARDGRFDRYLAGPGRYTVVARAPSGATVERVVEVPSGRVRVDIELP